MDKFIDFFTSKPRLTIFLLAVVFLFGSLAYRDIAKEETPEVKIPIVYVSVPYEGVSPADGEKMILKPLEKELRSVEGVKKIQSYAVTGMASVVVEFYAGLDNNKALRDVKDKVDIAKAKIPKEAKEPIIKEIDFSKFPVLNVILKNKNLKESEFIKVSRELKDRVEQISSVLEVNLVGDRADSVEITLNQSALETYKISATDLAKLDVNNRLITTGFLRSKTSEFSVKLPGLIENIDTIRDIPIKSYQGKIVRVKDIAQVRKTYKDTDYIARANGDESIVLEVSKRTGQNVINTIKNVKKVVSESRDILADVQVVYSKDSSENIMNSLSNLNNELFLAGIIVVLTVIFFIGVKQSLLIAVTIPASFFIGILCLYLFGFTMNIVVLFALVLSLGIVVDAGSIVIEYSYQKLQEGFSHKVAYSMAAKRMATPVLIGTLTTLISYMPLLFWPGVVGKFMKYLPITLLFVLAASFFAAIVFLPTIGQIFGKLKIKPNQANAVPIANLSFEDLINMKGYHGKYLRAVKWLIDNSVKAVIMAIIFTFLSFFVFGKVSKGVIFFPAIEPETGQVIVRARGNLSLDEKDKLTRDIEAKVMPFAKYMNIIYTRVGNKGGSSNNFPKDTIAVLDLDFSDWEVRPNADKILNDIRKATSDISGVIVETQEEKKGPPKSKDISFEISGSDSKTLDNITTQFQDFINADKDFLDYEDSRPLPKIEYVIKINRELLERYGLNISTIGSFVQMITSGTKITSFRPDYSKDEVDILYRFSDVKRNFSNLQGVKIITPNGAIPLSSFASIAPNKEISEIYRVNGSRTIEVKVNLKKGVIVSQKIADIEKFFKTQKFDTLAKLKFTGESEDQAETGRFLQLSFGIVLLLTLAVLVGQSNSFTKTAIIMSSVIFAISGVLIAIMFWGRQFCIVMTGLGLVSLVGIVVNNNIILIDMLKEILTHEKSYKLAILKVAFSRLDAILITTITTIVGVLPSAFGISVNFLTGNFTLGSPSSQWWVDLSVAMVGGLTFSTITSLFITPSLLLLEHKTRTKLARFFKKDLTNTK
jgi:multidrug efflux pump